MAIMLTLNAKAITFTVKGVCLLLLSDHNRFNPHQKEPQFIFFGGKKNKSRKMSSKFIFFFRKNQHQFFELQTSFFPIFPGKMSSKFIVTGKMEHPESSRPHTWVG